MSGSGEFPSQKSTPKIPKNQPTDFAIPDSKQQIPGLSDEMGGVPVLFTNQETAEEIIPPNPYDFRERDLDVFDSLLQDLNGDSVFRDELDQKLSQITIQMRLNLAKYIQTIQFTDLDSANFRHNVTLYRVALNDWLKSPKKMYAKINQKPAFVQTIDSFRDEADRIQQNPIIKKLSYVAATALVPVMTWANVRMGEGIIKTLTERSLPIPVVQPVENKTPNQPTSELIDAIKEAERNDETTAGQFENLGKFNGSVRPAIITEKGNVYIPRRINLEEVSGDNTPEFRKILIEEYLSCKNALPQQRDSEGVKALNKIMTNIENWFSKNPEITNNQSPKLPNTGVYQNTPTNQQVPTKPGDPNSYHQPFNPTPGQQDTREFIGQPVPPQTQTPEKTPEIQIPDFVRRTAE